MRVQQPVHLEIFLVGNDPAVFEVCIGSITSLEIFSLVGSPYLDTFGTYVTVIALASHCRHPSALGRSTPRLTAVRLAQDNSAG